MSTEVDRLKNLLLRAMAPVVDRAMKHGSTDITEDEVEDAKLFGNALLKAVDAERSATPPPKEPR